MATRQRGNGHGSLFKRSGRGAWMASWYDAGHRRRERSTGTTDKASACRILAKWVDDVALERAGVVDARTARLAAEGQKPIGDHVADYIRHCRHVGHAREHIDSKLRHLGKLTDTTGIARLSDLGADALEAYMRQIVDAGLSRRTANFGRQIVVAFCSWCVRTGRAGSNPLTVVRPLDERNDRRRVRRALTDAELARLLAVAEQRGRRAWYLCAALAGLRRGDLQRLTWGDIDFSAKTITIRNGKAKRTDVLPMHPQLADVLKRRHDAAMATPRARVFSQLPTARTQRLDFLRAGLARVEVVRDANGEPIMVASPKGRRVRPKTHIVTEDADDGRVVDLHALRTTLGTQLARAGVAPQIAQRIMRHADYKTTLAHYTVLGLSDLAGAVEGLPAIGPAAAEVEAATGAA